MIFAADCAMCVRRKRSSGRKRADSILFINYIESRIDEDIFFLFVCFANKWVILFNSIRAIETYEKLHVLISIFNKRLLAAEERSAPEHGDCFWNELFWRRMSDSQSTHVWWSEWVGIERSYSLCALRRIELMYVMTWDGLGEEYLLIFGEIYAVENFMLWRLSCCLRIFFYRKIAYKMESVLSMERFLVCGDFRCRDMSSMWLFSSRKDLLFWRHFERQKLLSLKKICFGIDSSMEIFLLFGDFCFAEKNWFRRLC